MIYPKFVKKGDLIGICAPSAGIGHKLEDHLISIKTLKNKGFKVKETKSVRVNNKRSTTAKNRAKELDQLVCDKNVKAILTATGGDYMMEVVPHINFENIKNNVKWMGGMSDPTNLLFLTTTNLDIATFYGHNSASLVENDKAKETFISYMKGDIKKQNSYKKYQTFIETINDVKEYKHDVKWMSSKNQVIEGRLIGGCLDVISKLIGTKYDHVNEFIDKYSDDGIVWYFDIFGLDGYNTYLTLLQLKYAGWFRHCKGILIGRVAFENENDMKYADAYSKALGKIPYIYEMDLGHTYNGMTLINGALCKATYKDHKGSISFKLK